MYHTELLAKLLAVDVAQPMANVIDEKQPPLGILGTHSRHLPALLSYTDTQISLQLWEDPAA
jgi:hypothetical protein